MTWLLRALAGLEENLRAASSTHKLTITSNSKRSDTLYWPPKFPEFTHTQRQKERQTDTENIHLKKINKSF